MKWSKNIDRSFNKHCNINFFDDGKSVSFSYGKIPKTQILRNCIKTLQEIVSVSETDLEFYRNIKELEFELSTGKQYKAKSNKNINRKKVPGVIYIYKDGSYYKIGRTKNHDSRYKKYLTENPRELELILMIPTDDYVSLEKEIHTSLNHLRVVGKREWFLLKQSDIEFIKNTYEV